MSTRSRPKQIHRYSITGQRGINLIERKVLEMGFVWYPSGGVEAGIDGVIETRDSQTGEVSRNERNLTWDFDGRDRDGKKDIREIDGLQHQQLRVALLSAFPTRHMLEMMVLDQLNENLLAIVGEGSLEHMIFELIRWSMAKGRLEELVDGALKQNGQNPQLMSVAKQLKLRKDQNPTRDVPAEKIPTYSSAIPNNIIQVQSKATEKPFQAETQNGFDYLCEERDLNYWLQGNAPVILIVSRPDTDEIYWVSIKDYFRDLSLRKARKIHFDKECNKFDQSCKNDLATLSLSEKTGIYLSPLPRKEKLWSNLLEVTYFTEKMYVAHTHLRHPSAMIAALKEREVKGCREWILKNKQIMSFYNLAEDPWREFCDLGTLECFDTSEWAYTEDVDRKREFVWLLNKALQSKVWPLASYARKKNCYYVRATPDLTPRTLAYQSSARRSKKTVFQGYPSKNDANKIAYYKHFAFEGAFRRFEHVWYLEITPTYYFTSDGYTPFRYSEEKLKGMKLMEHNPQVLSLITMWADYLRRPPDLFASASPNFLAFGQLMDFSLESGIDEQSWLRREDDQTLVASESLLDELRLFE